MKTEEVKLIFTEKEWKRLNRIHKDMFEYVFSHPDPPISFKEGVEQITQRAVNKFMREYRFRRERAPKSKPRRKMQLGSRST